MEYMRKRPIRYIRDHHVDPFGVMVNIPVLDPNKDRILGYKLLSVWIATTSGVA